MKTNDYSKIDLYYLILKECIGDSMIPRHKVSNKFGISDYDIIFADLKRFNFIEFESNNEYFLKLTPEGFNAYLMIGSQKQSAMQAKKATYFAFAALTVSIASFIASIILNLIS
jgi:hypothetical protein